MLAGQRVAVRADDEFHVELDLPAGIWHRSGMSPRAKVKLCRLLNILEEHSNERVAIPCTLRPELLHQPLER